MQLLKIPAYVWTFIIGFIIALLIDGCDSPKVETITIEKPVPKIERIEIRDTIRFGVRELRIDTIRDTLTHEVIEVRLDTMLKVDTLKIIDAWLTEVAKYDTTIRFKNDAVNLKWQNYQNLSEGLEVKLLSNRPKRLGLNIYAKTGFQSDFKQDYAVVIGGGLLFDKKRLIFGADYAFSGQHNINAVLGYRLR